MAGVFILVAILIAAASAAPQTRTLAIVHINVVDVIAGGIVSNSTVTINGKTITSVMQNGKPPTGARVLNGVSKYLIPGRWEMHAHTGAGDKITSQHRAWLELYVANGVTAIRDMGSELEVILGMREATSSSRMLGPRIFAAGPMLDDAPGDWPLRLRVKTAEDGRAAVQLLKQRGVDLIKVHDHTPREAFFAIADEAMRQNLPLAGHVPLGLSAEQVIDAGQGDIEHLSNMRLWRRCSGGGTYQSESCKSFFEMLGRRSVWQTPTLFAWSEIATIGTSAS